MATVTAPRGNRPKHAKAFDHAVHLQEIALKHCDNPKVAPHIAAALMRAWCDLEERKRVLKMKPLPKSVDVERLKEQRRAARAARKPSEPSFVEQPEPPAAA